ncbi:MAG: Hpt domain-containing protein [Actinomycetota bacterium]|nr:Hpt domain-containing protein [Actinomycetota bacterium]
MEIGQPAREGAALVVEPDPVAREVLCRMLGAAGWDVDVATDVDQGVTASSRGDYDAVLVGVPADVTAAAALTASLRGLPAGPPPVPVVAVIAVPRAAGIDEYLATPVSPESLAEVLARCRSRRSSAAHGAVLDEEALVSLRELGDGDLLGEVVSMFVEQADERLRTLEEAVREEEPDRLAREAHNLKGSSGVVGAARMVALCASLEVQGSSGRVAGAGEVVGRLREEFQLVRAALAAEMARPIDG